MAVWRIIDKWLTNKVINCVYNVHPTLIKGWLWLKYLHKPNVCRTIMMPTKPWGDLYLLFSSICPSISTKCIQVCPSQIRRTPFCNCEQWHILVKDKLSSQRFQHPVQKSTFICIKKGLQKWIFNPHLKKCCSHIDTIHWESEAYTNYSNWYIFRDQITFFDNESFKWRKYTFAILAFARIIQFHLWSVICRFLNTELLKNSRFNVLQYKRNWTGSRTKCTLSWEWNCVQHPCN